MGPYMWMEGTTGRQIAQAFRTIGKVIRTQSQLENCDNPDERVYKSNLGKGPLSEDVGAGNGSTSSKALHYGISKEISIR